MFDKIVNEIRKKIKQFKNNDNGSAFIFVVIGVMCVSMIGATVMSVATNYVTTVIVDHYSTDNFYHTEGFLSEIRSGIEEVAGKANEEAYLDVVKLYSSPKMTSKMKVYYGKMYLTGIVRALNGSSVPTVSTPEVKDIESTGTTAWLDLDITKIKAMTTDPDNIESVYASHNLQYRFEYDNDKKELFLVIRGLQIKNTDKDYHSSVKTDIRIGVPDYSFEGNSTYEELKNYFSISDDILLVNTSTTSNISGNIYTGTAKEPDNNVNDDPESGIEIYPGSKAEFKSEKIISRGNLNIFSGADVTFSGLNGLSDFGDLWLKNINVRKPVVNTTQTSKVDIRDNTFVLDDTSIEDDNATVNLGGNYYGYSYNRDNSDTTGGTASLRSDYSSAILVNGLNTTLTSNSLMKLILAGRTFVQRNEKLPNGTYLDSVDDIMMGESLAVKSNQIAYLVPDQFIVEGHNPLVASELSGVSDIRDKVNIEALKSMEIGNAGKKMEDFLKTDEEITANYNNSGQYVFLYLNFKSEVDANEYFSNYYNQEEGVAPNVTKPNKEYLDDKAQSYIATLDGSMKISPALYLIAGNIIHNFYDANGAEQESPNYFGTDYKPLDGLLKDGKSKMAKYLGLQMTLTSTSAASDVRGVLEDADRDELVKQVILNIIDTAGKKTADDNVFSKDGTALGDLDDVVPGHSDWHIVCSNDDYTIDTSAPNKGIILCAKNVTVSRDFEGLIIAGGKVSVTSGGAYRANPAISGEILDLIKNRKDKDWWKYFRCLDDKKKNSVNVAECISYQNWERNSD